MTSKVIATPLRILIVEDDPIMGVGLKQLLSSQPNTLVVGVAKDGDRGDDSVIPNTLVNNLSKLAT